MSAQVLDMGRKVQLATSQQVDRGGRHRPSAINDFELEADPDLHREVEIDLPRDSSTAGRSRGTMSRKSTQSKKSENLDASRVVKSRGRPMKPHETEPFLSINNLPPDKTFLSDKSHGSSVALSRQSQKGQHQGLKSSASVPLQRLAAYMSPYSQAMPAAPREEYLEESFMGSRNGRVTPSNTPFQSPVKRVKPPNHHVKSPFKHAVSKPDMVPDGRLTPSTDLKERTALATYHVNRMMSFNRETEQAKTAGNLLKGKLKPLYPVDVSGPDITQCRGIVSETRSYAASPSRTLQRRLNLISKIPNVHEYLYDRPRTVESVHQTSVASSVDDNEDNRGLDEDADQFDSNRSLPDEILYTTPMTRSATMRSYTQDPIITEGNTINQLPASEEVTPRFITEVNIKDAKGSEDVEELVAKQMQEIGFDPSDFGDLNKENKNLNNNVTLQQADDMQEEPITKQGEMDTRDAANRFRSPSKSVRFAVDPNNRQNPVEGAITKDQKEMERSKSPESKKSKLSKPEDSSGEKKLNPDKKSCKPDSGLEKHGSKDDDDDDDDDDDKNGNGKNRFSLQEGVNTTSGKGSDAGKGRGDNSNNTTAKDVNKTQGKSSSENKGKEQKSRVRGPDSRIKSADSRNRGQHCSRFERAHSGPVSLQPQPVLHGDQIVDVLGSTSPDRSHSRSRSVSPSRRFNLETRTADKFEHTVNKCEAFIKHCQNAESSDTVEFQFFSPSKGRKLYCQQDDENTDEFDYLGHRAKVKFQLDGEDPPRETIFIENEHDGGVSVELKEDKPITFEAIESELESLQMSIKGKLLIDAANEPEIAVQDVGTVVDVCDRVLPVEVECVETMLSDAGQSVCKTESSETINGEYSELLGHYRQRCMERSENIGAFSERLATPRTQYLWRRGFSQSSVGETISETSVADEMSSPFNEKNKMADLRYREVSDSGQGSEDNLSEVSRPSSSATLVPRLELSEGSLSDLGLGTERSDAEDEVKTILDMVCDELSPLQKDTKKKETREKLEEDVSKLKVIATTKSLSKPKTQKKLGPSQPQAPFPPLCFNINARPPKGHLYVFAYGPDMNSERFSTYVHREVRERFWAVLFGFNLIFNKKGLSVEAGGFANVEFNPLRSVEGCLYQIRQEELALLDKCVGYPKHYEHVVLPVWMSNSRDPDSYGVAQYCVPALLYIAQNDWTETETELNCDYSVAQCLKTDMITPEYRKALSSMGSSQLQVAA